MFSFWKTLRSEVLGMSLPPSAFRSCPLKAYSSLSTTWLPCVLSLSSHFWFFPAPLFFPQAYRLPHSQEWRVKNPSSGIFIRKKPLSYSHLHFHIQRHLFGTSLVVQWLRFWAPSAGGPGSISDQGTRSHGPQQKSSHNSKRNSNEDGRSHMLQLRPSTTK